MLAEDNIDMCKFTKKHVNANDKSCLAWLYSRTTIYKVRVAQLIRFLWVDFRAHTDDHIFLYLLHELVVCLFVLVVGNVAITICGDFVNFKIYRISL